MFSGLDSNFVALKLRMLIFAGMIARDTKKLVHLHY